jgi:polar amino acid transport system substrate-binding protein
MKHPAVFILIFILFVTVQLTAQNKKPSDFGPPLIQLAYYEFAPFYGNGKGIDQEIVDEIILKTGLKIQTQVMKRARIWADLESGALMMATSGIQTPQRDQFAWFVPYFTMKNKAVLSKAVSTKIKKPADFNSQSLLIFGAVASFKHGQDQDEFLELLRSQNRVKDAPDVRTLFLQLREGRIDGFFSQPPVYFYHLRELKMEDKVEIEDWTPQEKGVPHGLIFSKKHFTEAQVNVWRQVIREMKQNGALLVIYRRYLAATDAKLMLDYDP